MRQKIRSLPQAAEKTKNGIYTEGGSWYASVKGERIKIGKETAKDIDAALRFQSKIEQSIFGHRYSPFTKIAALLNCRKTIDMITGKRSLKSIKQEIPKYLNQGTELEENLSGVDELFEDLEAILSEGRSPSLGTAESSLSIGESYDTHNFNEPAVVHVFNIKHPFLVRFVAQLVGGKSMRTAEIRQQLNRDHTLLILGKTESGRHICFQKRGPSIFQPFELTFLDDAIKASIHPDPARIYVSFMRPLSAYTSQIKAA